MNRISLLKYKTNSNFSRVSTFNTKTTLPFNSLSSFSFTSSKFAFKSQNFSQYKYFCTENSNTPPKANFFQRFNEDDADKPLLDKHHETITKINSLLGYKTNIEQSMIHSPPIFEAFISAFQQSLTSKPPFKLLFPCLYLTALHTQSKYVQHHLLLFADRVNYNHRFLQTEILNYKQSAFFEVEEKAILDYLTEAQNGSLSLAHFEKVKKFVPEEILFDIFNICGLISFLSSYSNCLQIKIEDSLPKLNFDQEITKRNNEQIFVDQKIYNENKVEYKGDFEEISNNNNKNNNNNNNIENKNENKNLNNNNNNNNNNDNESESEYEKLVSNFSNISQETLTDLDKRKKVLLYGVKNSFGFIPNFMMGYAKYPSILRSALVLFNSIFQETQSLTPPMKMIIAIEASRGFHSRYLELIFTYLANKEKVPMTKLIQGKFTSNSITLQKIFNLSREITSSFGKEYPFTNTHLESLNLYLSKQQLVEVASSVGYLAYLRYISYSIFPLPEPAIVSFSDYLQSFKDAK